jgi:hypothetical protein
VTIGFEYLILVLLWSAATYRLGRFVALDKLIEGWRDWVLAKLTTVEVDGHELQLAQYDPRYEVIPLWRRKLVDLLGCPFCVTAYTSAAAIAVTRPFIDGVPLPVLTWLAAWTGGLVIWQIIDSE